MPAHRQGSGSVITVPSAASFANSRIERPTSGSGADDSDDDFCCHAAPAGVPAFGDAATAAMSVDASPPEGGGDDAARPDCFWFNPWSILSTSASFLRHLLHLLLLLLLMRLRILTLLRALPQRCLHSLLAGR